MLRKTHRAFATTCAAAYIAYTKNPTDLWLLPITWGSASLPDLDSIGKRYNIPGLKNIKHRGFINGMSHSLFHILGWWFLYHYYPNPLILGVFIGITSHILADSFSSAGIALLYPFQGYKFYQNGAFHVKGFRPFPGIYKTGKSVFGIKVPNNIYLTWYFITILLLFFI